MTLRSGLLRAQFDSERTNYLIGGSVLLLTTCVGLAIPWALKRAVEALETDPASTVDWALALIGLALVCAVFRVASRVLLFDPGRRIEYRLRRQLFSHMMRQPRSFFVDYPIGDVMSRATQDLGQVRLLLGPGVLGVFSAIFGYTGGLIACFMISPELTLYSLIPYLLVLFTLGHLARELGARFRRSLEAGAKLSNSLQGLFNGINLVRAHGEEAPVTEQFEAQNDGVLQANWQAAKIRAVLFPLMTSVASLGGMVVLLVGGRSVVSETITIAEYVGFAGYLQLLASPTISLGWVIAIMARGRAAWNRLDALFAIEPAIRDAPGSEHPEAPLGAIELDDLTFTYPGDEEPALRDISLRVAPGQMLGIVGTVGSGKTTLGRLLTRLEEPPAGRLLLDGVAVADWPLEALRNHISVVPQEIFLLTDRVDNNLSLGRPEIDAEKIESATRVAEVHDDILAFKNGFGTEVGERGITLSGGQRQRTAIARALLHSGRILLFDDCLSAVDVHTEARILEHLRAARDGVTTVVISTRLSAVVQADEILVLDSGRIVERGGHRELLARGGVYSRLWQHQHHEDSELGTA